MSIKFLDESKNRVNQAEAIEFMSWFPDACIDMILCDLPYSTKEHKYTARNEWDTPIPLEPLWEQFLRITKENAAIVLFASQPFTTDLIVSRRGLFKYTLVWSKHMPTGFLNANRMPLRSHEDILVFYRKLPTYNPQFWYSTPYETSRGRETTNYGTSRLPHITTTSKDGKRFPKSVLEFSHDKDKYHPTQKPVALCEYLIKTYTNEKDTVLDCVMGSWTTAVAAKNVNRNFIGCELQEDYCAAGAERLELEDVHSYI